MVSIKDDIALVTISDIIRPLRIPMLILEKISMQKTQEFTAVYR
jgi:hypothetical protein